VIFREEKQIVGRVEDIPANDKKSPIVESGKRKRRQSDSSSESSDVSDSEDEDEDEDKMEIEDEETDDSEDESEDDTSDESESDEDETSDSGNSSTSSSSSSSDSDSDSTTSSSAHDEDSATLTKQLKPTLTQISHPINTLRPPVPPGRGSERTHLRNQRKVRVKRLKRLIAEEILPSGSTLIDLDNYENGDFPSTSQHARHPKSPLVASIGETIVEEITITSQNDNEETISPPQKKVDVGAVTRFIKAGLVGNEGYDRAREEARVKGKEKLIQPGNESQELPTEPAFVPRNVKNKRQKTTHLETSNGVATPKMSEIWPAKEGIVPISESVLEEEDPLVAGFYEQVELATKYRQSQRGSNHKDNVSSSPGKKSKWDGTVPSNAVIRAFECEPEWCGYVEAEEGEEVDSVEIDPPELPFVDNYRRKKREATEPVTEPLKPDTTLPTTVPTIQASPVTEVIAPLSESAILLLPKLAEPSIAKDIYFSSMFLHPVLSMPVIQWRWGRITHIDGSNVTIDIQGPKFRQENKEDEEMEEGEIESTEEVFIWSQLIDIRHR
jgi:hypothetical protein